MCELPEHLEVPLNRDGNGPEMDPERVVRSVCWTCMEGWPCRASLQDQIAELTAERDHARQLLAEAWDHGLEHGLDIASGGEAYDNPYLTPLEGE
jgi:hypothetical protein